MNSIFCEMDKNLALYDFKMEKLEALSDMVTRNHELMYEEAAVNVFVNEGSYDDLVDMYEAADSDVEKKKGNILSNVVDAIKTLFTSLMDSITNFFKNLSGKKVPEKVEITKQEKEEQEMIEEFASKIDSFKGKVTTVASIAGLVSLVVGGTALGKYIKNRGKKNTDKNDALVVVDGAALVSTVNKTKSLSKAVNGIMDKARSVIGDGNDNSGNTKDFSLNGFINFWKRIGNLLVKWTKSICGKIHKILHSSKVDIIDDPIGKPDHTPRTFRHDTTSNSPRISRY